eukprot:9062423-Pyramimonas_sp.AAC.2
MGTKVSFLCDRTKPRNGPAHGENQLGFIDVVCKPMYKVRRRLRARFCSNDTCRRCQKSLSSMQCRTLLPRLMRFKDISLALLYARMLLTNIPEDMDLADTARELGYASCESLATRSRVVSVGFVPLPLRRPGQFARRRVYVFGVQRDCRALYCFDRTARFRVFGELSSQL